MRRVLTCMAVGLLTITAFAQWSNPANDIPAYNAAPPTDVKKLPPLLAGSQLTGDYFSHPYQVKVYQDVAKIPAVLHQLPCYCRCDRSLGHNSLHSCFEDTHGAVCATCLKEGLYAYRMTMAGKSVKQIRQGIEKGEFQSLDLNSASS